MRGKPTVPNTISDSQWADLSRRAREAAPPMFDPHTVKARKASAEQRRKANHS
ncbi:hypothetical protein [Micromonospora sp. NBS 11-29]|uniref:hypothetical protein n=1 Tax=Micromonospora sp. NBS 11-29 TaxID=1960879 RepID=UPI001594D9C0|nr:hypothetical protein [Micromonospora sp. NBS 11-29]